MNEFFFSLGICWIVMGVLMIMKSDVLYDYRKDRQRMIFVWTLFAALGAGFAAGGFIRLV